MTERCNNCDGTLRLARMPVCDVERVDICENCGRLYLGGEYRIYDIKIFNPRPRIRPRRRRVEHHEETMMN
jgi:hypothetical protein